MTDSTNDDQPWIWASFGAESRRLIGVWLLVDFVRIVPREDRRTVAALGAVYRAMEQDGREEQACPD